MASHSHGTTVVGVPSLDAGHHGEEAHESFIKTPRQLIVVTAVALIAPIVIIILLANFVSSGVRVGAGADAMSAERIAERIRPVASLELRDASVPQEPRAAEVVYKSACAACHDNGVAGAPKHNDKASWAPRIASGFEALLQSALKGKGGMPAQSGGEFSDFEIARAVVYMANDGGANFEAPKQPEAAKQEDTPK